MATIKSVRPHNKACLVRASHCLASVVLFTQGMSGGCSNVNPQLGRAVSEGIGTRAACTHALHEKHNSGKAIEAGPSTSFLAAAKAITKGWSEAARQLCW